MIITLTTDFGLRDPFVGVMKGRILARAPTAHVVDLSHDILAHWPAEAGFWLARCHQYFPTGTVHVAVVDPGVGTARAIAMSGGRDAGISTRQSFPNSASGERARRFTVAISLRHSRPSSRANASPSRRSGCR